MAGARVHVEGTLRGDGGAAIIGARGTFYEADGVTPLAGMKSAATVGSSITTVTTDASGHWDFWITGLPRPYVVVWDDNGLTATPAGSVVPLAAFSVTRGPHDMVVPSAESAQLDETQTWTGPNNFTGGLTKNGVAVATLNDIGSGAVSSVNGRTGDVTGLAEQSALTAEAALARNGDNVTSGTVADARIASTIARDSEVSTAVADEAVLARNADNLTSGTVADARIASTIARDSEVSTAVAAEAALARNGDNISSGTVADARIASTIARDSEVSTAIASALAGLGTASALASDTDGTLAANSDARIATQKAVKTYADALIAANDAMVFKGVIDCSANPNYPAADRGHTYKVSVAGKIGGASGTNVEVGDLLLCITDGTSAGTQAAVGANWNVVQVNIDGAVVGPASSTSGDFATFSGTSGKVVQDSGLSLDVDAALAANSDSRVSSQKAVKGYVDTATGLLVPKALVDAAGDLLVGTADNTVGRLAVGSALQVLRVNSGATALEWAAPASTDLDIAQSIAFGG